MRFCHFYAYFFEFGHIPRTAAYSAAGRDTAEVFRFVARADLTELDTGMESVGKVFYQLAEVYAVGGGEIDVPEVSRSSTMGVI